MANTIKAISQRLKKPQDLSKEGETWTARVVANYGDVGLTNSYYFDVLSRFLIVMIEPSSRMPTVNHWPQMFYLVQRPAHLWISVDSGVQTNITDQRRADTLGNVNQGVPGAYSWDNIPQINRPYVVGERIKVKKLSSPHFFYDSFFSSEFDSSKMSSTAVPATNTYNTSFLSSDPAGTASISASPTKYANVAILPLYPHDASRTFKINGNLTSSSSALQWAPTYAIKNNAGNPTVAAVPTFTAANQFAVGLNKETFEVFWRQSDPASLAKIDSILLDTFVNRTNILNDYFWRGYPDSSAMFNCCFLEDMNSDNKNREPVNDCMPLIVTNPATYPTPRVRQAGSILYNPTYSTVTTT